MGNILLEKFQSHIVMDLNNVTCAQFGIVIPIKKIPCAQLGLGEVWYVPPKFSMMPTSGYWQGLFLRIVLIFVGPTKYAPLLK